MSKAPPKKTRIRNPDQTRARLLQATVELVMEKGDEALSVKEVARVAQVSRANAYRHFDDREHLLREMRRWITERLMEPVAYRKDASMQEQVGYVARLVLDNPEAARLLIADAMAGKDLQADHPLYRRLQQVLEEFRHSAGARRDIDVEIMYFIMLGSVAALVMLGGAHRRGDAEALAQRYTAEWTRMLQQGLFSPSPRRSPAASKRKPAPRKR